MFLCCFVFFILICFIAVLLFLFVCLVFDTEIKSFQNDTLFLVIKCSEFWWLDLLNMVTFVKMWYFIRKYSSSVNKSPFACMWHTIAIDYHLVIIPFCSFVKSNWFSVIYEVSLNLGNLCHKTTQWHSHRNQSPKVAFINHWK